MLVSPLLPPLEGLELLGLDGPFLVGRGRLSRWVLWAHRVLRSVPRCLPSGSRAKATSSLRSRRASRKAPAR